jgi:hydrogenase maturation protease
MALIEIFAGYDRAVVVDSIRTGRNPPGTVTELALADVGHVRAPSVHHTGLPELAAVAERLGLTFPSQTCVFAIEVEDPYSFGAQMSGSVAGAADALAARVRDRVMRWSGPDRNEG